MNEDGDLLGIREILAYSHLRWTRKSLQGSLHLQQLPSIVHILEEQKDQAQQVDDDHAMHDAPDSRVRPHHAGRWALHEGIAWCRPFRNIRTRACGLEK